MSSLAQFLLIVVISTLTILITVVAVQVFQLLHEAKMAVRKFSQTIENTAALKEIIKTSETEIIKQTAERIVKNRPVTTGRFFHRAGQLLRPTRPS